jgi:hypothetical protein
MKRSRVWAASALSWFAAASIAAQTPQPFPKPGDPARPQPSAPKPSSPPMPETAKVLPPATSSGSSQPASGEPTEQTLGLPIYPGSQYITSYDAGRGQRYYLFGTLATFPEIVAYYRTMLKQRGDLVFETPAVHMFDVGRFREETMAFPPGVTIKDYTWGGSAGYINPKAGAQPTHFKTIIQLVPAPPAAAPSR